MRIAKTKKGLVNQIYNVTTPILSKMQHDDAWQGVSNVKKAIESIGIEAVCLSVEDGGYRTTKDGLSKWKEYKIDIEHGDIVIKGYLNCHAAGTIEDPFKYYDMTLVMF